MADGSLWVVAEVENIRKGGEEDRGEGCSPCCFSFGFPRQSSRAARNVRSQGA